MDYARLVRDLRRTILAAPPVELPPVVALIPHRPPFLFVSNLTGYDPQAGILTACLTVGGDDPVVQSHFPGQPLYPGTLQQEAIAQLGACLMALGLKTHAIPMLTRVHHAVYLRPISVPPAQDTTLSLGVKILSQDTMMSIFAGQVIADGAVCAVMVMEAVHAR